MKKLLLYIFLILIVSNVGYAENYLCTYMWKNEPESVLFERLGDKFKKSNGVIDSIAFEDEYAVVLENTYTFLGKQKPQTYSTLIDKKKLTFVMIGLEYENNTKVLQGKCKILN